MTETKIRHQREGGEGGQSLERATHVQELVGSISGPGALSLLVGSVCEQC